MCTTYYYVHKKTYILALHNPFSHLRSQAFYNMSLANYNNGIQPGTPLIMIKIL